MKKIISTLLVAGCCLTSLMAQDVVVKGPDEKLQLVVFTSPTEKPSYSITYNGKTPRLCELNSVKGMSVVSAMRGIPFL